MILICRFLPVAGMAVFPFIILKKTAYKSDLVLVNHERIHLRQQVELLIVPFFLLYFANYFVNLCRYRNHTNAYKNIVFEKEAYAFEADEGYLNVRKRYNCFYLPGRNVPNSS